MPNAWKTMPTTIGSVIKARRNYHPAFRVDATGLALGLVPVRRLRRPRPPPAGIQRPRLALLRDFPRDGAGKRGDGSAFEGQVHFRVHDAGFGPNRPFHPRHASGASHALDGIGGLVSGGRKARPGNDFRDLRRVERILVQRHGGGEPRPG